MNTILEKLNYFAVMATTIDKTGQTAQVADAAAEGAQSAGLMDFLPMILIYGGLIFAMYWFLFRPQRKREKEMQAMQSAIKAGDNVITTSGFYGKVVEVGGDHFVIEFGTNKGIRIPVRKLDIAGVKSPDNAVTHTDKENQ